MADTRLKKDSCFKLFYEDAYEVTYDASARTISITMKFRDSATYEAYEKQAQEIYGSGSKRFIR